MYPVYNCIKNDERNISIHLDTILTYMYTFSLPHAHFEADKVYNTYNSRIGNTYGHSSALASSKKLIKNLSIPVHIKYDKKTLHSS